MSQRRNVRNASEPANLDAFVRNTQMKLITLREFADPFLAVIATGAQSPVAGR